MVASNSGTGWKISLALLLFIGLVLITGKPAFAGCGPEYIIVGNATYKGVALTAADGQYTVSIELNGVELDSYPMGSVSAYRDYYVLRIPTEDGAGEECPDPTGTKTDQFSIYINGESVDQNPISIEDIDEGTRQKIIDISVIEDDNDGDNYTETQGDCNDNDASIYPGAEEVLCDGIDQNCNGLDDDDVDVDGDPVSVCQGDCDDTNANIYPGATEVCDGVDNDCDEATIDGAAEDWLGAGCDGSDSDQCKEGTLSCSQGMQACSDNTDDSVEICNGEDDDCDGEVDEGVLNTFYADTDNDTYGDAANSIQACTAPEGYVPDSTDCDDGDNTVYPGAAELCDGKDNDCDGEVDEGLSTDADGDGHYAEGSCLQPADDCNDGDNTIYPGAAETCDGVDNDCNGEVDEGVLNTFYADTDNDTYGDAANSIQACTAPEGYVANSADCNDGDNKVYPGAAETCDGVDNDCDQGTADGSAESWLGADCDGADGDLCAEGTFACVEGVQVCSDNSGDNVDICDGNDNDCNPETADGSGENWLGAVCDGADSDQCEEGTFGCAEGQQVCSDSTDDTIEICDGEDNDCDGQVDEGVQSTFYADTDNDTYGDAANSMQACTAPEGYVANSADCNDGDNTVYPGAAETCDGVDNDCDQGTADGSAESWLGAGCDGADGDLCAEGSFACVDGIQACSDDTGDNLDICDGEDNDCNSETPDGSAESWLGAECDGADGDLCVEGAFSCVGGQQACSDNTDDSIEVCDGEDNDCDGEVDEGVLNTFYADTDNDTYGDAANSIQACTAPEGYVANNTDCDDGDNTVYPGAEELCDGKDNDCEGEVDEGLSTDADGDGFTTPDSCEGTKNDCDDGSSSVYPGAEEVCEDGIDQDCNGSDLSCDAVDNDLDGYSENAGDCNDDDNSIYPEAPEFCDSLDNDCDGEIDEGLSTDADGDGFTTPDSCEGTKNDCDDSSDSVHPGATEICGDDIDQDCNGSDLSCDDVDNDQDGFTENEGDCDDEDATVYEGAEELCDGKDNDCDGQVDEGLSTDADGDGFTTPDSCEGTKNDCDDADAAVNPAATEIPENGKDDDCNAETPDDGGFYDDDNDGYTENEGDCDDGDDTVYPEAPELCDGKDNDCNGEVDEGLTADADGDGFTTPDSCEGTKDDCDDTNEAVNPGIAEILGNEIDDDCNPSTSDSPLDYDDDLDGHTENDGDCNDDDSSIYPEAPELCDGKDNDCNGEVDDGLTVDADEDGFTTPDSCEGTKDDCDDSDAGIYPGAEEIAGDGVDQDCDGNDPPLADAGVDQPNVSLGAINLSGSGTDADGDQLTLSWLILDEPNPGAGQLQYADTPTPVLTISAYGSYEIELTVCDFLACDTDTVTVSTQENLPPVAQAGDDQTADLGETVCLVGSGTDPNNDDITAYQWMVYDPQGSLAADASAAQVCFYVDQTGVYMAELNVFDGALWSEQADTALVTAENAKPVAVIIPSEDQTVTVGTEVCLDGSTSYDPDGDEITYSWAMTHQPGTSFAGLDSTEASGVCFTPDEAGDYIVQLIVTDEHGLPSDAETVTIIAEELQTVEVPTATSCADIEAVGLVCDVIEGCSDEVPVGGVISQEPAAGEMVLPDTTVTLAVSTGPCAVAIPCDLDGDGDVDVDDRNLFMSCYRLCKGDAGYLEAADYDNDGCITLNDYREWYRCYNENQ